MNCHSTILPLLAATVLCAPAFAGEALTCAEDSLKAIEGLNAALDKIVDQPSLKAALPEVQKAAEDYGNLAARLMKALGGAAPTPQEAQQLAALQQSQAPLMQKFQANMMRLQQAGLVTPELAAAFARMNPQAR